MKVREKFDPKFVQGLKDLGQQRLAVGWLDSNRYESGIQVGKVAAIQELGDGPIPPRPFVRPTVEKSRNAWNALFGKGANKVLTGKLSAVDLFSALGGVAAADIQTTITQIFDPPLSPLTLAARAYKLRGGVITGRVLGQLSRQAGPINLSGTAAKPLIVPGAGGGILLKTVTFAVETKS